MKNLGRNDLCHCGSGKKYKNCCYEQDQIDKTINQIPNNVKEYYKSFVDGQIASTMTICLVTSLEILKNEFGFTEEQIQQFGKNYPKVLQRNLKVRE